MSSINLKWDESGWRWWIFRVYILALIWGRKWVLPHPVVDFIDDSWFTRRFARWATVDNPKGLHARR